MAQYTIDLPKELVDFYAQLTENRTMEDVLVIMLSVFKEVIILGNSQIVEDCIKNISS